jgi:phosphatidylglycerol:prolipoprotein diacylglycerol transferase
LHFPVYLPLGPISVHPHWVFESLAYAAGYRVYVWQRAQSGDHLTDDRRTWVITAAVVGAAVGGKLLYLLADPALTLRNWNNPFYLMGGKTIVGGLIGGLIAVEWIKLRLGVERRTGDLFAAPLAVGIAVGRVGCFLSGLDDDTYGAETGLPWAVNFGDGVMRHPVQLYEVSGLALLALWLLRVAKVRHREGDMFKTFMVGYLGFRLIVDFLKPGIPLAGLTGIQWACLLVLMYYGRDLPYLLRLKESEG